MCIRDRLKALSFDTRVLKDLNLNFKGCESLINCGSIVLLSYIPQLQTLDLNFEGCRNMTNVQHLLGLLDSKSIQSINLNLTSCRDIQNFDDFVYVFRYKPSQLRKLRLIFDDMDEIEDLTPFTRWLSHFTEVEQVELSFSGCTKISHIAKVGQTLKSLMNCNTLYLAFNGCTKLQDYYDFIAEIFEKTKLVSLALSFSGCPLIGNQNSDQHNPLFPRDKTLQSTLKSLRLFYEGCSAVVDLKPLQHLFEGDQLEEIHLYFQGTKTEVDSNFLLPQLKNSKFNLRVLVLYLNECKLNWDRPSLIEVLRRQTKLRDCLLYTSPSPRDRQKSRMPSSA
eukprot:TRINITY_DN6150_c0_g1_i8.p1 TRINITY_DN6150_c0_g1~~TRINITY_DN6150_c0_g1_i8.p1  ORF type:complete len:336 (-),score=24.39 TRINITY_DN6150_c0_g1_i8:36-1043(-)